MNCPNCHHKNPAKARFCLNCGTKLEQVCPYCQQALPLDARFCMSCGRALSQTLPSPAGDQSRSPLSYTPKHLADKILTTRSALEGERKQVTVLFCDLANSIPMAERLGPEAMHSLLSRFFELALGEVHQYEGTINQFLGDGFMALFGAPIAYEDHARRAVLAALSLQRVLQQESRGGGTPPLQVRMGLNTGLVVVGKIGDNLRMDYTAVGDTTNIAARLQQMAEPGTILISEATARLIRGYMRLESRGFVEVRGKSEPVMVYKVLGSGPQRSPMERLEGLALSRFVGRERELAILQDLFRQVEGSQGQVVGIVGEPGAGKSRLLYELRRSLTGKRVTYLEGRCLSYGSAIPYLPVADIIRSNCGIMEADSPEAIIEKVGFGLQEVGMDPDEGVPYLLHLLGMKEGTDRLALISPEAIKLRTFETLRKMSLNGSRRRPIIFVVEDLHWIDKTSEEYHATLVESLTGAPILLLCTYRPGYRPPWIEKSYATQIALHQLTLQDSLSVVQSVLQADKVPDHLAQIVLTKAEGNPFFLEELARAVAEHGDLHPTLTIPDTIQGILMARIDRLPDELKRVLQTASVLGREVSLRLLAAMWEGPSLLEPHLMELKRLEFLYEQTRTEEPVYVFKHALAQELVYDSLLTPRHQALHTAAGRALEALYANRLEDVYDRLAYHYSKTGEAARAVEYLTRFAEKSARGYAHVEAVKALQEALAHVEHLPVGEQSRLLLDLVVRHAHSFYFLGRFQETLELLLQQKERLEQLQDPSLAGPYYFWLGHTHCILGDHEQAAQSAQQALEEAVRCGDEATMGKAYYLLAREDQWSGQPHQGIEHGRQAVSLLDRTEERWWLGMAHSYLGINYAHMGEFDQALEAVAQVHAIGEAIGDPRLQSFAAWSAGWISTMRGEWEAGIEACQRSLERSTDPLNTAVTMGFLGYAYLEKGDPTQAISVLEQSVEQLGRFRYRQLQGWFTTLLGEAYLLNGQIERGRDLALQGWQIARDIKFWYGVGLAQRALGRIARASNALSDAEIHLNEAIQAFTSIQERFEVGRTQLDLAILAHAQGNQEAAMMHLKEAHDLFRILKVPKYVERTEQLAREFWVLLSEKSVL
ncbi:MAG: AAA family ATPase [Candidatus Tectomicrobia bacterium]|nr:AAA family ATPase [Candidatus Tectomicrobia bacterium]